MKYICSLISLFTLSLSLASYAQVPVAQEHRQTQSDYQQLEQELSSIFLNIETNYGPLSIKKQTIGLDYQKLKNDSFKRLKTITNIRDYYFLIANIFNSFNDAHISISIPSSFVKGLPVQFTNVQNKLLLNYFKTNEIFDNTCGLKIGDELVEINGFTIDQAIASDPYFHKDANALTNKSIFALSLSKLTEERGLNLETNPIFSGDSALLTLLDVKDQSYKLCRIPYAQVGFGMVNKYVSNSATSYEEKIDEFQDYLNQFLSDDESSDTLHETSSPKVKLNIAFSAEERTQLKSLYRFLDDSQKLLDLNYDSSMINNDFAADSSEEDKKDTAKVQSKSYGSLIQLGHQHSRFKLPRSFKKIKVHFNGTGMVAGTFKHDGKLVGYLRIPSYMPKNILLSIFGIRAIMAELQQRTDYLLIDQMDNPGGSVVFSDIIIKSLVGNFDESKHMKFAVTPTQDYISMYKGTLESILTDGGGSLTTEQIDAYSLKLIENLKLIVDAYRRGDALSAPVSMSLLSEIAETSISQLVAHKPLLKLALRSVMGKKANDSTVQYTRPVYMLINELDFSGGDATPAILQDYGRVKLVGVRTAGAGGSVEEFKNTALNHFSYHLTTSLMMRKDGGYVENYGVQPDIAFELLPEDVISNYKNTLDRIMNVIDQDRASALQKE